MRAGVEEAEAAAVVLGRDVEAIVVAEVVGVVVEGSGDVAGLVKPFSLFARVLPLDLRPGGDA